jgi:Tol biopolymer transport system component
MRRADGVGAATRLASPAYGYAQVSRSSDGQWLVLERLDGLSPDIVGLHAGDTTLVPLVATPASENQFELSPDGKYLAYVSDESGTLEVYVRPFPNTSSARWQVSTAGGTVPLWSHSGKELFFRTKQGDIASVPVSTASGFTAGAPRVLFSAKPFRFNTQISTYDISPDDKRFLMLRETATAEAGQLVVSEHWLDDLKSRKQ